MGHARLLVDLIHSKRGHRQSYLSTFANLTPTEARILHEHGREWLTDEDREMLQNTLDRFGRCSAYGGTGLKPKEVVDEPRAEAEPPIIPDDIDEAIAMAFGVPT